MRGEDSTSEKKKNALPKVRNWEGRVAVPRWEPAGENCLREGGTVTDRPVLDNNRRLTKRTAAKRGVRRYFTGVQTSIGENSHGMARGKERSAFGGRM